MFRVGVAVRMGKVYAIVMFLLFSGSVAPVVCSVSKQDAYLKVSLSVISGFPLTRLPLPLAFAGSSYQGVIVARELFRNQFQVLW